MQVYIYIFFYKLLTDFESLKLDIKILTKDR
jgi:hypothetical protein